MSRSPALGNPGRLTEVKTSNVPLFSGLCLSPKTHSRQRFCEGLISSQEEGGFRVANNFPVDCKCEQECNLMWLRYKNVIIGLSSLMMELA